ncbi:MAG: hypothetical protein ACI9FO_000954 [Methylophagaceae bacterium]
MTQDIQLLGDDVSACIADTQKVIAEIVMLASNLARLFTHYISFDDLRKRIEDIKTETSAKFSNHAHQQIVKKISDHNHKSSRSLASLLSPIAIVVKKGEYLAVCSFVEAASAGQHDAIFKGDDVGRFLSWFRLE